MSASLGEGFLYKARTFTYINRTKLNNKSFMRDELYSWAIVHSVAALSRRKLDLGLSRRTFS